VANYIAKYATKALDAPGLPNRPIQAATDIDAARCSRHHKHMMTTAWRLGTHRAAGSPRLRKWAHTLGYGGHFLTKSRRYSVTFGQLRRARTEHRRQQRHPGGEHDPWGRPLNDTTVLVLSTWAYHGHGYANTAGTELALATAARAREHQRITPGEAA
jgi:Replication initiator protein, pSAM2